jgi:hypothetical protein
MRVGLALSANSNAVQHPVVWAQTRHLIYSVRHFSPCSTSKVGSADKPAVGVKFQRSGLIAIAAVRAISRMCQKATLVEPATNARFEPEAD